ncbi:MAG: alpha/beta hydrolase [Rhizobiales bacterium]|nr:alpha/beta hydrolase [Hyphomicrobiales bacterium]
METRLTFDSDGISLSAVLHIPDTYNGHDKIPAFIVLHGFMGSKDESHAELQAKMVEGWGYAALRFDFRGLGDSGGRRGYVLCEEQVADTRNAISWLATRPEIDPKRIGLIGHSFGAAVSVYTAGVDERVAAVISSCGWGNGARKFQGQHPGAEAWKKFTDMLARNREHKAKTGETLWVSRWDVVPIPEHLRKNLSSKAQMEVSADTAQSMYDFTAEDVVGNIAPRPLMLFHTANDQVTPTEQSIRMFERAGMPTELYLVTGESHFPLAGDGEPARTLCKTWLDRFFPVKP